MKLNYKRTFFIGLAFMSISAFWQLYDNIIPLILQNTFLIGETMTGSIMAIDNILALFLLPVFGSFSDKISTRFGKRIPFILGGTGFAVVFMILIPYAANTENFMLFFISLGIVLLSMSTYRSPAVALMPDLTPKPLRSKANAIINLMGAVGGISTLIIISLLVPNTFNPSYTNVFMAVAILMVFSVLILVLTINENNLRRNLSTSLDMAEENLPNVEKKENNKLDPDVKKSLYLILISVFLWFTAYNAVTTAFSRYALRVWNLTGGSFANALMVAMGAAIISYIPIGFISTKVGRKKTTMAGIVIMSLSYAFGFLFTSSYNKVIVIKL